MIDLLLKPEALAVTTVGLFLTLSSVVWAVKTIVTELKKL